MSGAAGSGGAAPAARTGARWIDAWHDPLASLRVQDGNLSTADLYGDGDLRLLAACDDKVLRVYAASRQVLEKEVQLLDKPTALAVVYTEDRGPRLPAVAVAAGSYVFIYRNLRPFFKFTLPALTVNPRERSAWERALESANERETAGTGETRAPADDGEQVSPMDLRRELATLRDQGVPLTITSAEFLALEVGPGDDAVLRRYILDHSNEARRLQRRTVVTCMASIPKDSQEPRSVCQLVVGTEAGEVFILSPDATSVVTTVQLPSVPAFLSTEGLYDVEYRILIACRNSKVYAIRNGRLSTTVLEMESPIMGLISLPRAAVIACMDRSITSFQVRGRRQYRLVMPARITALYPVVVDEVHTVNAIMVALANGDIRLYRERHLVLATGAVGEDEVADPAVTLYFGPLGRESHCLVSVHDSGALRVRILPRRASLEPSDKGGPPPEQDIPLPIPKKTRLYVDQTRRERDEATQMHRAFQRDLQRLRLRAARRYVQCLTEGGSSATDVTGTQLRLHAEVIGLGPRFRLKLTLTNTSSAAARKLLVAFHWHPEEYEMPEPVLSIPALLPQQPWITSVPVRCVDPTGAPSGRIRTLVLSEERTAVPLVSAQVDMPQSVTEEELGGMG